jgi:hypothetical protein
LTGKLTKKAPQFAALYNKNMEHINMDNKLLIIITALWVFSAGNAMATNWKNDTPSEYIPIWVDVINQASDDYCAEQEILDFLNADDAATCQLPHNAAFYYGLCGESKEFLATKCGKKVMETLPKNRNGKVKEGDVIDYLKKDFLNPNRIDMKYIICKINPDKMGRTMSRVAKKADAESFCLEYEAKRFKG